MRTKAALLVLLLALAPMSAVLASQTAPVAEGPSGDWLMVDGYVTTKFTSVGDTVSVYALTKGHSGDASTTTTVVTAEILHYEDVEAFDLIVNQRLPSGGVAIDTVVLTPSGAHEDDPAALLWEGLYTVPLTATGGVYGASITAEEGNLVSTDDATQIPNALRDEIESVLQAIDTTWDTANPMMDIKGVFDGLNASGQGSGGWTSFVDDASRQPGLGESGQLWNNMIGAGYNNPSYDMADGARFLEALLDFLESSDQEAGMAFLTGVLVYGDEFPLPRTLDDFDEVVAYMQAFDPIENFTRFAGTDNFSAAYDAMVGSEEWEGLSDALDNLSNNEMVFASFQTVLRNIALLSVSAHPEAIIDGLEAWAAPLADEDYGNMTPFQRLVYGWSQMDVTVQDLDGDDFPDEILWEYELLLNTTEGLQWQARMDASYPHVSDGFDDFNTFDVDVLTILRDTTEDPAWDDAGNAVQGFLSWAANATLSKELEWSKSEDESDDGEDGDDGGSEDSSTAWEEVIFDGLHPVETLALNKYKLDLGFELYFECEGCGPSDMPNDFNMSVTDSSGQATNVVLDGKNGHHYVGRFTADRAGTEVYTFSQPMAGWTPPCADDGCIVSRATLEFDSLRPSLLESMATEANEELFVVSALGVLVDADETVPVASEMTVQALVYDAAEGALFGAEMDSALLRISPGLGVSAASSLSPNGDMMFDAAAPAVQYSGDDVDGVLDVTVEPRQTDNEGEPLDDDQAAFDGYLSASGDAFGWNLSSDVNAQVSKSARGVALFTTTGITNDGLEFRYEHEAPLPDSPGCMISTMQTWSQGELNIEWSYGSFRSEDGTPYPYASLDQVDIDYGDGSSFSSTAPAESGGESYTYDTSDGTTEHLVTVQYTTEHGHVNDLSFTFDENAGILTGDEGEEYHTSYHQPYEDYRYCQLKGEQQSSTPSPAIIDRFISDGPFEVLDQQVLTSNAQGTVDITAMPPHTGAYVNIVQASHTDALTGVTRTGIGFNIAMATTATVGLSGMDVIDHFAGLPVYAANVSGISQSIQVVASGLENTLHHAVVGHMPLDFSEVFPDVNFSGEAELHEMTFNAGESSRSLLLNHTAPLSLVGVMMGPSSAEEEGMSDPLTPAAMHFGLIVVNPEELNLTGSLGPGQITNVALHEDLEAATRILAVASPSQGFDPAVIDTSTVSELLMTEAVRPEVDWAGIESDLTNVCEEISWYAYPEWDDENQSEYHVLHVTVHHHSDDTWYGSGLPAPNLVGATLIDESSGAEVNWTESTASGDHNAVVRYDLPHAYASYRFSSGTSYGSSFTMEYNGEEWEEADWNPVCDSNLDQDEQADDVIDFLDTYASRFSTVAWGQGSSADLALPALSSPISEYTVIGVAQQGSGAGATLVSAVSTVLSVPNPEPPQMQNLTLVFTPSNPAPGDVVLLTVTDESNQPVEGLSVTLVKDNMTLSSLLSDANGQASFAIPQGNITIRVSGGLYHPAELNLSVEDGGIDGGLPGDRDGDGVGDTIDAFPDDPQEWDDTDGDGIGNNADSDDDGDGRSDLMELTGNPATDPLWPDSDNDGYCDGSSSVAPICTGGDAFPADATEWVDTDDDALGDNRDDDDDDDGVLDEQEVECGSDPLLATSVPSDVDSDGICDALDGTDDRPTGEDPIACCEAVNAQCLACAADMTVEAYCLEYPDTTGCAEDDENDATGEPGTSGAGLSSTVLVAASATGALILAIFVAVLLLRGRNSEPTIDKDFAVEEALFNELAASVSTSPPSKPPRSATGQMYDGYEGLEYPADSGQWYYRDPDTGEWTEWR